MCVQEFREIFEANLSLTPPRSYLEISSGTFGREVLEFSLMPSAIMS